jgi:hypothetical protein
MSSSTKRFLLHSTMVTFSVALIILHATSLEPYGLGLFLLSYGYSGYRKGEPPSIWWLVVLSLLCGVFFTWESLHGVAFARRAIPGWFKISLLAVWAFDIAVESRGWLVKRRLTHDV